MVYDLAIIGGGINGAALLREAAARGANVILLERADFGSGSTSRSSRLLHCGLRYLAPGTSMARFLSDPRQLAKALKTVHRSMTARNTLVAERSHLLKPIRMTFPIYEGDVYRGWQIDAAFAMLGVFGWGGAALDYRRYRPDHIREDLPFVECLSKDRPLRHVIAYTEYQIDWPERLAVDMILEAEAIGAVARNYCPVNAISEVGDLWRLETDEGVVETRNIANLAGPWVDEVAGYAKPDHARMVNTTRGAHLVLSLPKAFEGHGIMSMSGLDHPFYCFPWRDRHFIGPTESPSVEDPDTVCPTPNEQQQLRHDLAQQLPGIDVASANCRTGWAGLRPLTHEPKTMMAARARVIHDLGRTGGPKLLSLTNGSIGAHAITANELASQFGFASTQRVTPVLNTPDCPLPDTHVRHLEDLLWRRQGTIWDKDAGLPNAATAAAELGRALDWDQDRIDLELQRYKDKISALGMDAATDHR